MKKVFLIIILIITIILIIVGVFLWKFYFLNQKPPVAQENDKSLNGAEEITGEKTTLNLTTTKLATIPGFDIPRGLLQITFDSFGRQVAYRIITFDEEAPYSVFLNDNKGRGYYYAHDLQFSGDGQFAYIADIFGDNAKGREMMVVLNGKEHKQYYEISNFVFSPDGKKFAYIATKQEKNYYRTFVVSGDEDGEEEGEPHHSVFSIKFSPDSKNIAYEARDGDKLFIVVNSIEQKPLVAFGASIIMGGDPHRSEFIFGPDSKEVAYIANDGEKEFVVVNGKEGKRYDIVGDLKFSFDSQEKTYQPTYLVQDELKGEYGVIGNKEDTPYNDDFLLSSFIVSPDGKRLAYKAKTFMSEEEYAEWPGGFTTKSMFMIMDGKKQKEYSQIVDEVFSPDSQKIAYRATDKARGIESESNFYSVIIVDGEEVERSPYGIYSFIFSPDSKKLAYVVTSNSDGAKFVICRDEEGKILYSSKIYDDIDKNSLIFTPDGKYLLYGVRDKNEFWWIAEEIVNEKGK